MRIYERGPMDASLGISRRTLLRRGVIAGGVLVWATPVTRVLAGPATAAGTAIGHLSFVAVSVERDGQDHAVRWDVTDDTVTRRAAADVELPRTVRLRTAGDGPANGTAPGVSAVTNADGSVTVDLGADYRLVDFVVSRDGCHAGPGERGQPVTGQTGGIVTFPPLPDDACG